MAEPEPIRTERLVLVALPAARLTDLLKGRGLGALGVKAPDEFPSSDADLAFLRFYRRRLEEHPDAVAWCARAVVDREGAMVGHAGLHGPPLSLAEALADPSYEGSPGPPADRVVEIGYTVFPDWRGRGYATEAARGLIGWAREQGVEVVLATARPSNEPSHAVLRRCGFRGIGRCTDEGGAVEDVLRLDL